MDFKRLICSLCFLLEMAVPLVEHAVSTKFVVLRGLENKRPFLEVTSSSFLRVINTVTVCCC